MSFSRLIYWSCLIGGWSAFVGWLVLELVMFRWVDSYALLAILMATLVAAAIGGGVSLASALNNPQWDILFKRLLVGLIGGLVGGLLGSLLGAGIFSLFQGIPVLGFLSRVIGWTLIGLGVGVTEGLIEGSPRKIRNGLLGGAIGGFLAGLTFIPVSFVIGSPISSRAVSFVLLGLFIGLFIGLAQVILKDAWLTVEEGFRPGRQVLLGHDEVTMGTSEKSSLIFIAFGAKGVEPTHLRIRHSKDAGYVLEDNQSRSGTLHNGRAISAPTPLRDNDTIQLGVNVVRFKESVRHGDAEPPVAPVVDKKSLPPVSAIVVGPPPLSAAPAPKTAPVPKSSSAVQAATPRPTPKPAAPPPKATPPPQPAAPPAAVTPAAPAAAEAPQAPQLGRCPICDKKVMGIPNERRCPQCLITF